MSYVVEDTALAELSGYDPSYEIEYYDYWCGYEESGWLAILVKQGQFYSEQGGYSVYDERNDIRKFDPTPITELEAIDAMIEFDEIMKEEAIGP